MLPLSVIRRLARLNKEALKLAQLLDVRPYEGRFARESDPNCLRQFTLDDRRQYIREYVAFHVPDLSASELDRVVLVVSEQDVARMSDLLSHPDELLANVEELHAQQLTVLAAQQEADRVMFEVDALLDTSLSVPHTSSFRLHLQRSLAERLRSRADRLRPETLPVVSPPTHTSRDQDSDDDSESSFD
jgi:hypothetical protein